MVDIYQKLSECRSNGLDAVIVTVTEKDGMAPCDVGKKMIVIETGEAFGTIGGGSIEYFAREKCKEIFKSRVSFTEKYLLSDKEIIPQKDTVKLNMACGGNVTLFYEFVGPKNYVYIFGAGHCGNALAKILSPLGFHVTVIDDRASVLAELDNSANIKLNLGFEDFFDKFSVKENAYFVVSTPSHLHDFEVLDKIFEKCIKPAYFGMLCSKKKIADYLDRIYAKYGKEIDLENFYSPIGLDLGGDSPEEVAISIASEILSHFYNKSEINSHMRNRIEPDQRYFKK